MLGFLRALGGAHGKKAIQGVTDAIVAFDPETASEAQLDVMEKGLDEVGRQLSKFRADSIREQMEADAAKVKFDRFATAAQKMNGQYEVETDAAKKAALGESLNKLITMLEEAKTVYDQEAAEAVEAKALLDESETVYRERAEALKTAQANLKKGARDLERAKMAEASAQQRAENAAQLAGLRNNEPDGLNAALTAMQRQTDAARGNAETLKIKSTVLGKSGDDLEDPNIKAALAAVNAPSSALPFSDRLAALTGSTTVVPVKQIGTSANA
jgi:hypothetical protein